ncbi:S-layer homology domain-containing protein [Saccharibacillus qingshengii]|uniref:S-layer homology domain-containing protein n=1 Tax=Saccharibacillus qingshengii TaxID=1763540 RepID=UPI0015559843
MGISLLGGYRDADQVSNWARESLAAVLQSEIVSGRTATSLAPKTDMTRAEAAAIIERLLKVSGLI